MTTIPCRRLVAMCISLLVLATAGAAHARQDQEPAPTLTVRAGFDGYYKGAYWVPVDITLANEGPAVEGLVRISVGSSSGRDRVIYSAPVSLPTRSNKRLTQYVYLPNLVNRLSVDLVDGEDNVVTSGQSDPLSRLDTDALLYGVLSPEPGDLEFLEDINGTRADAAAGFLELESLPDAPAAWNALDVLVLHEVDTAVLRTEQMEALRSWISTGGQLVVAGGPGWSRTTTPLLDLLPVTPADIESREDLPDLAVATGEPFRDEGPYLLTVSSLHQGELLFHQDGTPILARREFGRGNVYFLALDPSLAPLVDWDGGLVLWSEIAVAVPELPPWAIGAQNSYTAGRAVTSLPSLSLPSTVQLLIFLSIYVIAIGPGNYLILRRLRRRELAWVTIPGLVAVFTILALLAGFQLKGNNAVVNQMSIAFGRIDGDRLRIQSLLGLYSPRRATYDLQLPEGAMVRPFNRDMGVLAGGGSTGAVESNGSVRVKDVRVDVSAVETFVADSYNRPPLLDGQASLRLDGSGFQVEVTVQNNDRFLLENAAILFGNAVISMGDLSPGSSVTVNEHVATSQATAAVVSGAAGVTGPRPVIPPGVSPLAGNYDILLGTSNYFNDREAFPRWQLLQSITPEFGAVDGNFPQGTVTLVAWSTERQLEVDLGEESYSSESTTLYFLELPLSQTTVSGQGVTVPEEFMEWEVLATIGDLIASPSSFFMPPGQVEFEYRPWPEFRSMNVTGLEISLTQSSSSTTQPAPQLALWDWNGEAWSPLSGLSWGQNRIPEPGQFIGPGNAVRIRVQNDGPAGINIGEIYPRLMGDM